MLSTKIHFVVKEAYRLFPDSELVSRILICHSDHYLLQQQKFLSFSVAMYIREIEFKRSKH